MVYVLCLRTIKESTNEFREDSQYTREGGKTIENWRIIREETF